MKGKALSILLYVTAAAISCQNAPVTEENPGEDGSPIIEFSDPKFLEALLRPCIPYPDMNGDGRISEKEAASTFAISCNSFEIKDISEIRYFTNLEQLCCHENLLADLDLSGKLCILKVNCSDNPLEKVILPSGHFKDYTIVEQIAESIREEYGDIVEYR